MTVTAMTGIAVAVLAITVIVLLAGSAAAEVAAADGPVAAVAERFAITIHEDLQPVATLDDYLGYALQHNQELAAEQARWRASRQRRAQVTALPDLELRYTEYLESVETRVGPQQRGVGLAQGIPWPGLLSARGRQADARASAAGARVTAAALTVLHDVRAAYWELAYLESTIEVTREHFQLLRQWEQVARSRYAAGRGDYADVVRAQVELGTLEDRLTSLEDRRPSLRAILNVALGRSVAAPVVTPSDLAAIAAPGGAADTADAGPEPEVPSQLPDGLDPVRLLAENPELDALRSEEESFGHARTAAVREGYPDFGVGVDWIQTGAARMEGVSDSGKDPVMARVMVNLPLWRGKYDALREEADAGRVAAAATVRDRERALAARLADALYGYRDAWRRSRLYGPTLVPKGQQSLEAARASYEAGRGSFFGVVDAERVLLELELSYRRALADRLVRQAEIEMLTGLPLSAALMAGVTLTDAPDTDAPDTNAPDATSPAQEDNDR
ncbi:MAG: TolC family protein [Candidatus Krumholzibacteriia bacterium]